MKPRAVLSFLNLFSARTRRGFAWACALSAVLATLDFVSLALLYPVFGVLAGGAKSSLHLPGALLDAVRPKDLAIAAMVAMVLRSVASMAYRVWWTGELADAEVGLSNRLLRSYAFAPYAFHLRRNSAELLSRSVMHVNAATLGLNGMSSLVADTTCLVGLGAALFVADPAGAMMACGYLAAVGLLFFVFSRGFIARQALRYASEATDVYRRVSTLLRGVRELTVAGARDTVLGSIAESRNGLARAQRTLMLLGDSARLILELALYLAVLLAMFTMLRGRQPQDALPTVGLYVVAGLRILPVIVRQLSHLSSLRSGMELGRQLAVEMRAIPTPIVARQQDRRLPSRGTLVLQGVSFRYDEHATVLDEVHLTVPYGCYLAIVGPSGAGKSTLLGIVLGLLAPTAGMVTYGGAPVGLADPQWLRHVGYVPQEVFILDDTVLANVALGDVAMDREKVWQALARASLDDVIRAMPEGLETRLGESGCRLSAGQRQRLGIARALYRNPAVLVLDEPTASLDMTTEAQITGTMGALAGTVTIIIVAHRMETIERADMVVRLDRGRAEVLSDQHGVTVFGRDGGASVGRELEALAISPDRALGGRHDGPLPSARR